MGFELQLKSSGGEYEGYVPFKRPDNLTFQNINDFISTHSTYAGRANSDRYLWDSAQTTCQYLDGFYSGITTVNNFPFNTHGSEYMHIFFTVDLLDENGDPTGYKIAVGPTCTNWSNTVGGCVCIVLNSNNEYVREIAGAGASQGHSSNNKVAYFIWERPDGNIIFGTVIYNNSWNPVRDVTYTCVSMDGFATNDSTKQYGKKVETALISEEFGTPSEAGGYTGGTFDDSSDVISLPTMPSIGVTSAGFVNVYNPSVGDLQNFGAELFPDLTFTPSSPVSGSLSVSDAIEAMANALVDLGNQIPNIVNMYINSNLIQYVIDCHILPVAPTQGASEQIKVGFRQFSISSPKVTSDYVDFDCGSLSIGEYYANFIDYAPYTHAKLFLPFVGFVDLAPEFWQSGTVQIIYRFNIIDGSFMAFVLSTSSKSKLTNSVIMQFGGNACVHIPITGLNYSSMVSGVVSGASAVISQASGGSLPASAVAGIKESITQASAVMQNKPPLQQSNGYNATTSFLSVRKPYLLIERSVSNFSMNYTEEKGIPSNITADFSNLSGYTQSTNIHLDGITGATEEELNELSRLLQEGVIL